MKSPEDRNVELLTFGEKKQMAQLKEKEERLEGLFPEGDRERPLK